MVAYYAVMAALAAVNLFVFLMLFREKKLNYYILALLAIITVSNTGNFLLATANSGVYSSVGRFSIRYTSPE